MKTISIAVLAAMLACSVARAEPPTPTTAAQQRRRESFKDWWVWSLVAVLSAGTIVTSVVIATVPRGSLNTNDSVMAVTVRF